VVVERKLDRAKLARFIEDQAITFPVLAPAAAKREDLCGLYDVTTHPRLIVIAVDGLICMDVTQVPEVEGLLQVLGERAGRPGAVERGPGSDRRETQSAHRSVSS
jgi:hypothetical protein